MKQALSQSDVADKLNISRQSVSNWENSKTCPDLESLKTLSQLYQVSIDELLGNTAAPPHDSPDSEKKPSGMTPDTILVYIVLLLFLFTFFLTAPYGIAASIVILLYNKSVTKSKFVVALCGLTIAFHLIYFAAFLLL